MLGSSRRFSCQSWPILARCRTVGQGAVDVKVKGIGFVAGDTERIYDATDLVAKEAFGIFVATSIQETSQARQGQSQRTRAHTLRHAKPVAGAARRCRSM